METTYVPDAEEEICALAGEVLNDVLDDDAPDADDLVLAFRILRHDYGRATLDVADGRVEGEGFGPAEQQWLTTIALNLISMLIWVGLERGWHVLHDESEYQKLRSELIATSGRARAWIERMIDRARNAILSRHSR